jgi:hypothetical protein
VVFFRAARRSVLGARLVQLQLPLSAGQSRGALGLVTAKRRLALEAWPLTNRPPAFERDAIAVVPHRRPPIGAGRLTEPGQGIGCARLN